MLENTELKKKINRLEEEKLELKQALLITSSSNGGNGGGGAAVVVTPVDAGEMYQMRQANSEL